MKLLLIHAEKFEFEVREKAIEAAEDLVETPGSASVDNALVCFTTVESVDETNVSWILQKAVEEIKDVASKLNVKRVVVYPYAHLSPDLANPTAAKNVLKELASTLISNGFEVVRAPFGWYKRFTISCIGHPLAELSRTLRPSEAAEEYSILTPEGEVIPLKDFDLTSAPEDFRQLVRKEVYGEGGGGGEPKYLDYCRKFGIEWESFSDQGHMRYGPEAALMIDLLAEYAWSLASSLHIPIFRVKGTNMFDLSVPAVKQHADLFGDRLYVLEVGQKKYVMRYAACHQQFAMLKDWNISYRHLPFGVFEIADSYRLEQPGELTLCFRLRRFLMPDLHILARSLEEAKELSFKVHEKIYEEVRKVGRDYVSIYNLTRSFLRENIDYLTKLASMEGKPVLLHFVPEGKYYWVINVEYNIIDQLGRPREIGTFQIDVGNAQRFGITYVDEDGSRKYPVIIHTALIGSLERYLYLLMDTAARNDAQGDKPSLPLWLSPVQVRLIPVSKDQLSTALAVAEKLNSSGVRTDVDDRDESLAKRIRDAEVKWIPYIVVLGTRETSKGVLNVRKRDGGSMEMSIDELIREVNEKLRDCPRLPLPLPILVSTRPGY
ncbi:MAG: threonine--tRNA ligase [Thermofilaceae archaeon]|nr:threonine--tRNA ligase [Thermofilaceae archaeon]MCX8181307.1 threonine--tRNA ligase [Thermofilaceae archaeon]MDW8004650.1 threonine--tRNA ligase [Thermofilaceae archaeon]